MKPTLQVTADFTENFKKIIDQFRTNRILVGIPEEKATRKPGDTEAEAKEKAKAKPLNNATILAINHFGVESRNIPKRPVLVIGLKNCQDEVAAAMKKAAQAALSQGWSAVDMYYNRAGIIASNSVKKAINAQTDLQAPAERTLRARKARGFQGTKTLIVTGQMRNAITYVVQGKF